MLTSQRVNQALNRHVFDVCGRVWRVRVRVERVCMRQRCIGNRRVCQAQTARGAGVSIDEACMRVEGRGVALELLELLER